MTLEHAVMLQTSDTAKVVGLHDRGIIRPGLRADINVIDFDKLRLTAPCVAFDSGETSSSSFVSPAAVAQYS